jgi:hypothetical protein
MAQVRAALAAHGFYPRHTQAVVGDFSDGTGNGQ